MRTHMSCDLGSLLTGSSAICTVRERNCIIAVFYCFAVHAAITVEAVRKVRPPSPVRLLKVVLVPAAN